MSKTQKTTNTSKTVTSTKTTPVNNNSKVATTSTKKTTPTLDKVVAAILTGNTNTKTTTTTTKKMPPTHSAYNQLGKKRGSYSQNIWVIEASEDGKKWSPSADSYTFYKSRDEAREDVISLRSDDVAVRFRVAKYTFTAVSHS